MLLIAGMLGMLAVSAAVFMGDGDDEFAAVAAEDDADADTVETEPASAMGGLLDDAAPAMSAPEPEPSTPPLAGADTTLAPGVLPGPDPDIAPAEDAATGADDSWGIVTGDGADDAIQGSEGSDFLIGYDGDDQIGGGDEDDQIEGEDGADSLGGGAGDDTLHGQAGDDLAEGGAGDDDIFGHDGNDTLSGGEGADSLVGGMGGDSLDGGTGDDALHGYHGHDTLAGGAGADTLFGGWGDDMLTGLGPDGADDGETDYLNGGDGADQIVAGAGDIVTAGAGADTIALSGAMGGSTEIMDFVTGEDSLLIEYDADAEPPEVELVRDAVDGALYRVLIDGTEVAAVHSVGGLGAQDIALVPRGVL